MVDRKAMLAVGGFDEGYVDSAFREESEGHARLWHGGWCCWLTPSTWSIHVRHRLGGGCRGRPDPLSKLRNRWSYWRNDCRYINRHHPLWMQFGETPSRGVLKARSFRHIIRVTLSAAFRS